MDGVVAKPIAVAELFAAIDESLASRGETAERTEPPRVHTRNPAGERQAGG
jgi:hypothetical protein